MCTHQVQVQDHVQVLNKHFLYVKEETQQKALMMLFIKELLKLHVHLKLEEKKQTNFQLGQAR